MCLAKRNRWKALIGDTWRRVALLANSTCIKHLMFYYKGKALGFGNIFHFKQLKLFILIGICHTVTVNSKISLAWFSLLDT